MREVTYRERRAARIENHELALTVTESGGHVAELLHKPSGISPLWIPHWRSLEPAAYSDRTHPEYGQTAESQLVAGLMGHNICLDLFGAPDPDEARAGMPVHGEAPVATYALRGTADTLQMSADLPLAQLGFERTIALASEGIVRFRETVTNLTATARPIAWTQHVTLGAPFLVRGETRFLLSADLSRVYERGFNDGLCAQAPGADFAWPTCPRRDGSTEDLSVFTSERSSGGFTAHRMLPGEEHAYFLAWSPSLQLAFGYVWRRADFPWLSRWEENHMRTWAPWNGKGLALGMEFGVSPMIESRRQMVERGRMFDTPCYRWLPARESVSVDYCAFLRTAAAMPQGVRWDGEATVKLIGDSGIIAGSDAGG